VTRRTLVVANRGLPVASRKTIVIARCALRKPGQRRPYAKLPVVVNVRRSPEGAVLEVDARHPHNRQFWRLSERHAWNTSAPDFIPVIRDGRDDYCTSPPVMAEQRHQRPSDLPDPEWGPDLSCAAARSPPVSDPIRCPSGPATDATGREVTALTT
jgi:hypothetical protein